LPKPTGSALDLDAEIKEERVWMEDGRRPVVFFDRSPSAVWIRDRNGSKANFSGELHKTESVVSQLREPYLYPELSSLRSEMSGWRFYHHFRTDPESPLRRMQIGVYTPVLSHDGSDLAAALQTILEIGDSNSLVEEIERAFEGARMLIGRGNEGLAVLLEMPGLQRPLNARELPDGTLRYFCLVAALLSPRPPSLLALNEPETSLHPDLLEPLARLIAKTARVTQLWITTHSLRLAELIGSHFKEAPIQLELSNGETLRAGRNSG
jgi:predicted ATPase